MIFRKVEIKDAAKLHWSTPTFFVQKINFRKQEKLTTNYTVNVYNACPSLVMLLHFYVEYITPQRLCKFAMTKKNHTNFFSQKESTLP